MTNPIATLVVAEAIVPRSVRARRPRRRDRAPARRFQLRGWSFRSLTGRRERPWRRRAAAA